MTSPGTILLAPKLEPSLTEIKKALLLSERFATISSPGHEISRGFKELRAENFWEPVHIHELDPQHLEEAIEECWTFADDLPKASRQTAKTVDWIKDGKLPYKLQADLESRGMLMPDVGTGQLTARSSELVPTLLSIFGRRIAESRSWGWTGTSEQSVTDALSPGSGERQTAYVIGLPELPTPSADATVYDVIRFRQRHGDELQKYFDTLAEIRRSLADGRLDDLGYSVAEYKARVREVGQAAHRASLPMHKHARGAITRMKDNPLMLAVPIAQGGAVIADAHNGSVITTVMVMGVSFAVWAAQLRPSCKGATYLRKAYTQGIFA